ATSTGSHERPTACSAEACRYVPSVTPVTACAAVKARGGTSRRSGQAIATARPTSSPANRYDDGTPIAPSAQPATPVAAASATHDAGARIPGEATPRGGGAMRPRPAPQATVEGSGSPPKDLR